MDLDDKVCEEPLRDESAPFPPDRCVELERRGYAARSQLEDRMLRLYQNRSDYRHVLLQ
jgi:hypothetical protein